MAKIALELRQALQRRRELGDAGRAASQVLARGDGWEVADVLCTSGPADRPFEERHAFDSIAIVLAGTFQYRSAAGRVLMTPGSLLLGSRGQPFECSHEHGEGDRCVAFSYAPDYFERLRADAGFARTARFAVPRVPPLDSLTPLAAAAGAGIIGGVRLAWEELAVRLALRALSLEGRAGGPCRVPLNAEARVTRSVRTIDRRPDERWTLASLAEDARLSPYHFLRTFERLTGVTPHQYLLRARLREAAIRLATEPGKVVEIAFDCGFGDVSNFNRAFRTEFGMSPLAYRQRA